MKRWGQGREFYRYRYRYRSNQRNIDPDSDTDPERKESMWVCACVGREKVQGFKKGSKVQGFKKGSRVQGMGHALKFFKPGG